MNSDSFYKHFSGLTLSLFILIKYFILKFLILYIFVFRMIYSLVFTSFSVMHELVSASINSPTVPPVGQMAEVQQEKNFSMLPSSVVYFVSTHRVENLVIDGQINTYALSRIMHLPYFYMLNYEQLGLHSAVEACVWVTIQSHGSSQLENLTE